MHMSPLWIMFSVGYVITILIETPILLMMLSRRHSLSIRAFAGLWLTACTYPIVILVLPALIDPVNSRGLYLSIAETFAPLAECAVFWLAFRGGESRRSDVVRDCVAITLANVASFMTGVTLNHFGTFEALFRSWG